ncbi:unnamed protein product [Paramecium sonneborni]|uniref:Uncharacterized protein n=1 Tax=Paramecium sonneborni TaxID=65129 RepID=A0A8S1NPH8_9CILI|nr:unnamed protein product [Paramecium sonneborni]
MKKVDYDLLVIDKINMIQYRKIIRCSQDASVHHLKQKLSSNIKCSFAIIFNEEILTEGMPLKEIFSKHIQNCIHLNFIEEPIPDQIKRPQYQPKQCLKKMPQDEYQEIQIDQFQLSKILQSQEPIIIDVDQKSPKCCLSCQTKKQILSNYQVSIESLLEENAELKQQISELEKQNRISIYNQKIEKLKQKK